MKWTAALVVFLMGCQPVYKADKEQACAYDVAYPGDLVTQLREARTGEWSYVPEQWFLSREEGFYEFETGDFYTRTAYMPGHRLGSVVQFGTGTVWPNGDVDTEADVTMHFSKGGKQRQTVRLERHGCEQRQFTVHSKDNTEKEVGTFKDDGYHYTRNFFERGRAFVGKGVRTIDGAWTESVDYQKEDYTITRDDDGNADGSFVREFEESLASGWSKVGRLKVTRDGVEHWNYQVQPEGGEVQYFDYDVNPITGKGSGVLEFGSDSCDLSFEEGVCRRSNCTAGGDGACFD